MTGSCSSWAGTDRGFRGHRGIRGDWWGRSSLQSASTQPGLCKENKPLDYFMDESAGNADGALGAASPRRLHPGPPGSRGCSRPGSHTGELRRVAEGSAARTSPAAGGAGGEPWSSGRRSQRWATPRHGATGPGASSARADNNKERIWVRASAGLCRGCAEAWPDQRLQEQLFLGILHLRRVRRGWAAIPGNWGPACSPLGSGALVSEPA